MQGVDLSCQMIDKNNSKLIVDYDFWLTQVLLIINTVWKLIMELIW